MNCRKVSGLLSAYLDQELTGEEMLAVRAHLGGCPLCRSEHQSLADTKRLLASLALQTPRADLEQLLLTEADRAGRPWTARLIPDFVRDWVSFRALGNEVEVVRPQPAPPVRLRPLAATAVLSLAGLCLATAKLSGTHEESPQGLASAEMLPGYASFTVVPAAAPVAMPQRRQALLPASPRDFAVPHQHGGDYGRAVPVYSLSRDDAFRPSSAVLIPVAPRVSVPSGGASFAAPYSYSGYEGGGSTATAAYIGGF